jgi:hypothetical protein
MATIGLSRARALCSPSELQVVKAASKKALVSHSAAALKKHVARARKLSDKWRDLAARQRREAQKAQGSRGTDKAARSQEKADLFGEVLTRLEAQQARQPGGSAKPAAQGTSGSGGPNKSARTQEHRSTRAQVRRKLGARPAKRNAPAAKPSADADAPVSTAKKAVKKKTAKKTASRKAAQSAATGPKTATAGRGKKTAKKKTVKTTAKKRSAAAAVPAPSTAKRKTASSPLGGGSQKAAEAAAKRKRVKASGLDTRIRGHVSARGKRAQGRRDARGGR